MDAAAATARNPLVRAGLVTAHLTRAGGGIFTSARQLAKALGGQPGLEVEVFGPVAAGKDLSDWRPIKPRTARIVGPRSFAYAPQLDWRLAEADLDLTHLHGLWMYTSVATLTFTRKTGRAHLVSPHGMLDPWALRNSGWKKRLAARFFEDENVRSAGCLHALNVAENQSIREYGYRGPVCQIPNGVDLPSDEAPPAMPWWKKSAPEIKTLLYLGRLHPKKGLPNLLKAWSRLGEDLLEGWRLVIAGWDEDQHKLALRRMATVLRIETTTTFPGALYGDDKRAAFYHCDGFILPSLSEGLPIVVLEAWAAGKPVVMTPQCNLPEGYEAEAALRIEAEEESIEGGLNGLLRMEDGERMQMGANGRELVSRRFAWPVIAAEMTGVYRWLAGAGPKPATVSGP